ncbi:MAG: hypothetical protein FD174_2576 [Geobacteraceae bacterium]|nr:MAG: hypothetical protein FD174_2576 [Geobacteraceae bacterium]
MYPITYNGIEGQAGLFAKVMRKLDGKFWGFGWVAGQAQQIVLNLAEDAAVPGQYTGNADFNASNGGVYVVSVFTAGGVLLMETECLYRSRQQTILETIKELQRWLRLPEAGVIAEGHAQLLLGFANEVQLDYMADYAVWDEMKLQAAFDAVAGLSIYALSPIQGGKVDMVGELRISDHQPLTKLPDVDFRAYVKANQSQGEPIYYRHYGRAGAVLLIEVAPTPDITYRIDANLLQKPAKLVNGEDVPLLDQDTIILGMKYLARKDQGEEYMPELETFQAKIGLKTSNIGEDDGGIDFL